MDNAIKFLIGLMFILGIMLIICTVNILNGIGTPPPIKETTYVPVKDTTGERENITKIIHLQRELELTRDSLNMVRDSLGEDLFIANYKLARIKKYNQIAAKGNNIKYLRGWINRTLNE